MKRILAATVNNQSGVLNRVTGLFSKRHFNIESISVGHSENQGQSKMTFVIDADDPGQIEQVVKQLNKQIDVLKVSDITDKAIVVRELALIKVSSTPQIHREINAIIEPFRASIIDVSKDSLAIEVTGKPDKIEAVLELLRPYGIKEISRTGLTAFLRGLQPQSSSEAFSFSIIK